MLRFCTINDNIDDLNYTLTFLQTTLSMSLCTLFLSISKLVKISLQVSWFFNVTFTFNMFQDQYEYRSINSFFKNKSAKFAWLTFCLLQF